ncbi:hypothetical protein MKY96_00665 [Paenibacillus sp. FSL R7-0302]
MNQIILRVNDANASLTGRFSGAVMLHFWQDFSTPFTGLKYNVALFA